MPFNWNTIPFIIACQTVIVFVYLSFVHKSIVTLSALYVDAVLFCFLLIASTASLIPKLVSSKFLLSSVLIWIVVLCRVVDAIFAIMAFDKYDRAVFSVEQVPVLLNPWILFLTSRVYFGKALHMRDPKNNVLERDVPQTNKKRMHGKGKRPRSNTDIQIEEMPNPPPTRTNKLPKRAGLLKLEILSLLVWTVAAVVQEVLVLYSGTPNVAETEFSPYTFAYAALLVSGIIYALLKVGQMQSLSNMGVFFGKTHSNGFAWFLLFFGFLCRITINTILQIFSKNAKLSMLNFTRNNIYIDLGREIFTQFIPLSFHLFNIIQQKRFSSIRGASADSASRIKLLCYIIVSFLHLIALGYVQEEEFCLDRSHARLLLAARSAGFIAIIDLCFVAMAFISPFIQFLSFMFNIAQRSVQKLYFHRNMAWSACLFSFLHILLHSINWIRFDPNITPIPSNSTTNCTANITELPPQHIYSINSMDFVTGIVMVVCILAALITGTQMTRKGAHLSFFSLHAPFACAGFIACCLHGGRILGPPVVSRLFLGIIIFSVALSVFFVFFARIRELEVDYRSRYGKRFILLSMKYNDSTYVPPGCFFNIYASADSYLSIFHCHSFPIFSTRNSRIVFLIQCRTSENKNSSFTSRIADDQPSVLRVQGPFKGLASSFILSLSSIPNQKIPNCIFLCGWNAGFASVFSVLEYFKDHGHKHNLLSVNCVFARIDEDTIRDELHVYIETLVHEWFLEVPLTIIETETVDSLRIMTQKHDELLAAGMDKNKWQDIFPHCEIWFVEKTKDGGLNFSPHNSLLVNNNMMLYYCGDNFKHEDFPEPKWQTFVESS